MFRYILNPTEFCSIPSKSENNEYKIISVVYEKQNFIGQPMQFFPVCFEILGLPHAEKSISESWNIKPNSDCGYTFPIYLTLSGIIFGAKLIRKV